VPTVPETANSLSVIPADVLERALASVRAAPAGDARVIVAVAGPPGAGKSTFAAALAASLDRARVLPMDGFHLDNETLSARGLLHRKGAPDTFDTAGLDDLLMAVKSGGATTVPTFDREADCVVPDGGHISEQDRIIVVEGNYLLLQDDRWAPLHRFWDLTIMIEVSMEELETRLVKRWLEHGLSHDDAVLRAQSNDLLNAGLVMTRSIAADLLVPNG
jgi:pantothenate kinase